MVIRCWSSVGHPLVIRCWSSVGSLLAVSVYCFHLVVLFCYAVFYYSLFYSSNVYKPMVVLILFFCSSFVILLLFLCSSLDFVERVLFLKILLKVRHFLQSKIHASYNASYHPRLLIT